MNKKIQAVCLCVALFVAGMLFMSASSSNLKSQVPIPKQVERTLINMAVEQGAISKKEGTFLTENHAIQQCVDAFISNGYEPSAAVDKLAELGVSSGTFKTKDEAKQEIKNTVEKARKKEATWNMFYKMLGL